MTEELKLGKVIIEGKTKVVKEIIGEPHHVLLQSKDRITAGNNARSNTMEGKGAISTATTATVFSLLNKAGIKSHFVRQHGDTAFVARKCEMVPIEWVTRRVATGSFLKRNPGVPEGHRFTPVKMETFFKDDDNDDPQWSTEQIICAKFKMAGVTIGINEVTIMARTTVAVFEVLEKAWQTANCSLVDMKIEFGIDSETGEVVLADVIDSDSWRLWPNGDKRLMKDKQVYRELKEITDDALQVVKKNFAWVLEKLQNLSLPRESRVVVFMGSASDMAHADKVQATLAKHGIKCIKRISSAHKETEETLRILAEYEGDHVPTVLIAIAGRSNGLGPVLSGNTALPVINCPPVSSDWAAQDVWSSLRMPSGLGCGTVLTPEAAALNAASMLALNDHLIWSSLRCKQLNTYVALLKADANAQ